MNIIEGNKKEKNFNFAIVQSRFNEEIGERLGINGPTEMYRTRMKGKWWYVVRVNASFILSISLGSVYLFLWL